MMNLLKGISDDFQIKGSVNASDDDLKLIAQFIGEEIKPDDVAVIEAVALDSTKNSNGWQAPKLNQIDSVGGTLNYDHSGNAVDDFGVIFAESVETVGDKTVKVIKAAIPKTDRNRDVLTNIKFKVANKLSPAIKVTKWADEKNQIVESGRLVHLSVVQSPAYGDSTRITSLAASQDDDFAVFGKHIHGENVTTAVRLAERKAGGFTAQQRADATAKYQAMNPAMLTEIISLLKETLTAKENQSTSQRTISAQTSDSTQTKATMPLFKEIK